MWGMNFAAMPMAEWPNGFWVLLLVQLGLGGLLLLALRRRMLL
jgi:magnesium transporter